jgi:hypothetical protein
MPTPVLIRSYSIQNDARFAAAMDNAASVVSDLRVAWGLIAKDWFKSNKAQFSLKGSGQYPPLSEKYAERKARLGGAGVPILVGVRRGGGVSGKLRDSISGAPNSDSIIQIGKQAMILGTRVAHGIYHQSDLPRRKVPLRKFLFIGPEAPSTAPSEVTGRLERWLAILEAETQRKLKARA